MIFVHDIRQLGMCISGIKEMARIHNLDFYRFMKEGIDIEQIKHIDDSNFRTIIAHVMKKQKENPDG